MCASFKRGEGNISERIGVALKSYKKELRKAGRRTERHKEAKREIEIRIKDFESKLFWRKVYYVCLLILLFGQNVGIFFLLFKSKNLELDVKAISVVATATLAETYGLVTIIVKHLVKDIEYRN